ncbi:MAG: hypothetical protein A07HR60_00905 [uncultured archaeon A07HR60]|nr:MAG: hypothetical protein A07HR60_00905 [uncultured archaeon A07HR60]
MLHPRSGVGAVFGIALLYSLSDRLAIPSDKRVTLVCGTGGETLGLRCAPVSAPTRDAHSVSSVASSTGAN